MEILYPSPKTVINISWSYKIRSASSEILPYIVTLYATLIDGSSCTYVRYFIQGTISLGRVKVLAFPGPIGSYIVIVSVQWLARSYTQTDRYPVTLTK